MAQSYKTLKEEFVSNLSGGSVSEINYATAVAPAAYLLWSALETRQGFFNQYGPPAFLADFLLNVGALLLAITVYSSNLSLLNALLLSPAFFLHVLPSASTNQKKQPRPPIDNTRKRPEKQEKLDALPVRPFITAYRAGMNIITCLAILAVDFRVFPRRFAKVETWGTSLMDMGVGSFVFTAGVISARPVLQARYAGENTSLVRQLRASFKSSLPLLVLGFIRLYSVKGLDYAEHVTEYGVHWNFFFTLAFLPPLVALLQPLSAMIPSSALLSLVISGCYQAILDFTNLKAYILTAPRVDLLSENREGILSFWGYLAIFLAGQAIGFDTLSRLPLGNSITSSPKEQRKRLLLRLAGWSILWSVAFMVATSYYGLNLQVSRRLANFPYVVWVSAFNCAQITAYCFIETFSFPGVYMAPDKASERRECEKATSRVFRAYNRNGLSIFLLANLLTGLVNLTLDTIAMGRIEAMCILIGYALLVTAVAVGLDARNLSIKL